MLFRPCLRLLLILPLALAFGCDDGVPEGKIHLRYMAWGNPEQMALEEHFCNEFNKQNPDIHVTFFRVPSSNYQNKAIVMMASRTAPDVIRIDHYAFPSLVRKNYFLDMTDLAAKDPDYHREEFFPQTIREALYQDRLYGLTVLFGANILYYNKSMVRAAGLEDPYKLWERGEWTYERYRQHAIAMTKMDERGRPKQFGCAIAGWPFTTSVIRGFGGDLLTADGKRSRLAEPAAIQAYQFLADLRWKDKCAPTPSQAANSQFSFESGKLGMMVDWMGLTPRLRTVIKDFDWDVCPLPSGPGGFQTAAKGNQLVIYRESAHPEAAWKFARYMTGPIVERELYVINRRSAPTRRALAYSPEFLKSKQPPYQLKTFITSLEKGREFPITERWAEWTTVLTNEQDKLFSNRNPDVPAIVREAARKIDEVLADEEGY